MKIAVTFKPEFGGILFETANQSFVYSEATPFSVLLDFLEKIK